MKRADPQSPGGYFINGAHNTKIVLAGLHATGVTGKFNFASSTQKKYTIGNSSNTSLNGNTN